MLVFTPGPIFAHIVLADEINRTPPKTQAALLEAMQEHRVTVQGKTYVLDPPFFVFANCSAPSMSSKNGEPGELSRKRRSIARVKSEALTASPLE